MTVAALLLLVGVSFLAVLLFGALVELHRQLDQLRQYVGLAGDAQPMSFDPSVQVDELPIPVLFDNEEDARAAVLVLSDHCLTCTALAEHLPDVLPRGLAIVLESNSGADALRWLAARGRVLGPQVVYDDGGNIAEKLGLDASPAVVRLEGDQPVGASTIPSVQALETVLRWLNRRETSEWRLVS